MPSLIDLRVLVLSGGNVVTEAGSDFNLLARHATTHQISVQSMGLVLGLRLVKRLLLRQDDAVVLYDVSAPRLLVPILLFTLWRKPVLSVSTLGRAGRLPFAGRRVRSLRLARDGSSTRERVLLHALAKVAGRPAQAAARKPVRIDLGCGSQFKSGYIGIDARRTPATAIVCDARQLAVASKVVDEVYASCLLEHFENPHEVLQEIHRVLKEDGQAVLRLPNLGTYSSHLDLTHRFLADLALWRRILAGYFDEVLVSPVGTKYRDNATLVAVNWALVNLLGWNELAQGWDMICSKPKHKTSVEYIAWWDE